MHPGTAWIIIAEDNKPDVFLIREALNQEGLAYRADVFGDGEEVLKFIARIEKDAGAGCPDVFVIDLNLPKRSGLEILSRLRQSARCGGIPAIVISSSDAPADHDMAGSLGVYAYFRKPSQLEEFFKIGGHIRAALDSRSGTAAK